MSETLRSELVGTAGLGVAAAAALVLTVVRDPRGSALSAREGVVRVFLIGLALQCAHFAEEYVTSFHARFPLVLGLRAWSPGFFVAFNLFWLIVWLLSATGVRGGYRPAFFPVWFFAIAMMANGVAHPLLALGAGGYFPGLLTSPLVGAAGVALWSRLQRLTRAKTSVTRAG